MNFSLALFNCSLNAEKIVVRNSIASFWFEYINSILDAATAFLSYIGDIGYPVFDIYSIKLYNS